MSDKKFKCALCGYEVCVIDRVGRLDECPNCHRDLHSCFQCQLYDRSYHNGCRETQSSYVADKERSNFCEFFTFGRDVTLAKKTIADAKTKLDGLFKKTKV